MQPVGGGAPRPGCGPGFPGSLRQLDPVALLMLLVDADRPEPVRSGARELALFLTPEPGAEAKEVEETIEGMLLRLEEFCSLTDMAFVKMVGHHVSFLEAHVLQAERDHGAFPRALQRWLGSAGLPSFRNDAWLQVTATQVNLAEANKRSPGLMDRSRPRVTPASGNDGFGCSNDIVRTSSHSISQLCDPVLASIPGRPCTVVAEVALRFMNHPPPRPWVTAPVGQASHPLQPPPEP
ncbi:breast carcinoma-amplified sequence 4 isoform X2 [Mirounga angustirostris]|uniref:breast carcinoma-amplified sequence 4 isoform X2 n=1 Tax=Mirounga angustirostris TaxID=9716 RepID=UPI00313C1A38